MKNKRIMVFASGGKEVNEGGSGLLELAKHTKDGSLKAEIIAAFSNHQRGGVYAQATLHGIPFFHFPRPWDESAYQAIVEKYRPDLVCLSGWLKRVVGLNPTTVLNIHPGLLPKYGGSGMYGHHVHEAVVSDVQAGLISYSGLSMHFVTPEIDGGPVCFQIKVSASPSDTAESLARRVNQAEHMWQWWVTNLVVNGEVKCVQTPDGYKIQAPQWYLRDFVPAEWWFTPVPRM